MLREGSQTEPNRLAVRLMPLPMMNARRISTVARPMANATGRQSPMVYRSQDAVRASGRQAASSLSTCSEPPDGGRSMCADLLNWLNWRLIATAASRLRLQRPASRRGGMLGCFRCLEAPEQQPEGEKDDLERCDGKDKDVPP